MKGKHVVDVECGSSHSACILDNGALYTWGKGRYGRLGHNDYETQYKPKQVKRYTLGSHTAHNTCTFPWGGMYTNLSLRLE